MVAADDWHQDLSTAFIQSARHKHEVCLAITGTFSSNKRNI